jgi:hypothetical protein
MQNRLTNMNTTIKLLKSLRSVDGNIVVLAKNKKFTYQKYL